MIPPAGISDDSTPDSGRSGRSRAYVAAPGNPAARAEYSETVLSSLVACHECDLLHNKIDLDVGDVARCVRCQATLYGKRDDSVDKALAIGSAALIMFVVASAFPFLKITVSGTTQSMSIISAVYALANSGLLMLALACFGFILLFPLLRMAGLLYILLPLRFNTRLPGMELVFRGIVFLSPWSMMEIYLFGAIVALVKLASMANIELGFSFWAFALLNILATASLHMIDKHSLWEFLSDSREREYEKNPELASKQVGERGSVEH